MALVILAIVITFFGMCLIFYASVGEETYLLLGIIVGVIGLAGIVLSFGSYNGRHRDEIFKSLSSSGWQVTRDDINSRNTVNVSCLTFKTHKIGNTYKVVIKRPKDVGGGFVVVRPSIQEKIKELCTSITSSS